MLAPPPDQVDTTLSPLARALANLPPSVPTFGLEAGRGGQLAQAFRAAGTAGALTGQASRLEDENIFLDQPRKPIGTRELRNGVMSQVVALDANNNPVWRPVTEPGPLGRRILEQGERAAEGFGPSGGAFLAYLDSLGRMDPVLPGFGGQQRAAEVARFTAALPSNRLDFVDDTGTPRQTRTAFEASVFFTEQAYLGELPFLGNLKGKLSADTLKALRTGAMPKIATEQVWDAISARNNWGLTGAEVLEQAGYIDRGGGIWERVEEPQISGYGGGSFGSGAGEGFPAFGFPSSPFRNPLGMVNWRIV